MNGLPGRFHSRAQRSMRRPRMPRSASTRGTQSGTSPRSSAQTSMSLASRTMARRSRPRRSQTFSLAARRSRKRSFSRLPAAVVETEERLGPLVVPGREETVRAGREQRAVRVPAVERLADPVGFVERRGSRPRGRARAGGCRDPRRRCGRRYRPATRSASAPSFARRSSPRTCGTESQRTAASSKPASARSARVHASAGSNQPRRPFASVAGTCQMRKKPSTWSMRNAWKNRAACARRAFHQP